MEQPTITFVLNGKTFSLCANDRHAIAAIPAAERQHLLTLLEAVKSQEEEAGRIARQAMDKARRDSQFGPGVAHAETPSGSLPRGADRMGSGDIDSLMARLAMEENLSRKPAPTRAGIYKWVLVCALVVVALVLLT